MNKPQNKDSVSFSLSKEDAHSLFVLLIKLDGNNTWHKIFPTNDFDDDDENTNKISRSHITRLRTLHSKLIKFLCR